MDTLSSPTPSHQLQNLATDPPNPTVEIPPTKPINDEKWVKRKRTKTKKKSSIGDASSSSSSSSSSILPSSSCSTSSPHSTRRFPLGACKRRNPKLRFGPVPRNAVQQEMDSLALLLGMSIAAFVNLVLEKKDTVGRTVSIDDLQMICTSAVRESLAKVYGDRFDFFARNFERSFGSTLRNLRLINESFLNKERRYLDNNVGGSASESCVTDYDPEIERPTNGTSKLMSISKEFHGDMITGSSSREVALHEEVNQLACVTRNPSFSVTNRLTTVEKSLVEQTRANDLKTWELDLTMKKMRMKETELALHYEANHLGRSKLEVGVSKACFKAEKFKTELEDTRQGELLKRCIDCLVAGLFIMLASLLYGAYVFSYQKIAEATSACMPSPEESRSWWIPKRVASVNSGLSTLKCQIRVITQMLFGLLIILAITYSITLRSSASKQAMPVTFILLLLGVLCGFAGKFCVDTLGGSGYHWLALWEALCLMHFLSSVFTSSLFVILYGPITVTKGRKSDAIIPYWIRRVLFYATILLLVPVSCGLIPFASLREWKDHFSQLAIGFFAGEGS